MSSDLPTNPQGNLPEKATGGLAQLETKLFQKVNPLVKFSVTRYVLAVAIFLGIFAFGVVSTVTLGVDLMPELNIPVVLVRVNYTGATPDVINQEITEPIENQVTSIEGVQDIDSTSSTGVSRVRISFDQSTDKNVDANYVSAAVSRILPTLPTGIQAPMVLTFDPNSQPIIQFGVWADGIGMGGVGDYIQNQLTPQLERIPGVANIQIDGLVTRQIQVLLDPSRLALYDLNPQAVTAAIAADEVNLPIGSLSLGKDTLTFATNTQPVDLSQIRQTLVDSNRGITVADLGTVREMPVPTDYVRINGHPAILLSILKTTDSNTVSVGDGVRKAMATINLPTGYHFAYSNDTTGPIRASVDQAFQELINTTIVVAIIVLLFLGRLNTAFSVILAIPIAISAGPVLFALAGFTFNLVSILALIVAIGIVVDDSIVIAENVERYQRMGIPLREAVLRGASEVFSAVVAASLSLLAVLIPVSFIGGVIGRYLMQFSLGLSAAVLFSLLEALLFLTVRLAYTPMAKDYDWGDFARSFTWLGKSLRWGWKAWRTGFGILLLVVGVIVILVTKTWLAAVLIPFYPLILALIHYLLHVLLTLAQALTMTLHNATEAIVSWVRDRYVHSLKGVLKFNGFVLLGALALFVGTVVFLVPKIPFNFQPSSDGGLMYVSLHMPPGTSDDIENEYVGKIEKVLLKKKEVKTVQTLIYAGQADADLTVQLVPIEQRKNVFELAPEWRKDLLPIFAKQPSARLFVNTARYGGNAGGFGGGTAEITFTSADFGLLKKTIPLIRKEVEKNPYAVDVTTSLDYMTFQRNFMPNQTALKGTGITTQQIALALETYATGIQASNLVKGGLSYPVYVMANPILLHGAQSLLDLQVYSPTLQTNLSMRQLGSFVLTESPLSITRHDRLYSATVDIDLKPNAPPALAFQNMVQADLIKVGLVGQGVDVSNGGAFSPQALAAQLGTLLPMIFGLALFLVYLVMASQFNSWKYPIYLLMPVPLALIGALVAVYLFGGGMDLFAMLGLLMLIGLSAKNAIIYLEFVMERIGKMPLAQALIEAAGLRFRPIIMTTLTVLMISFPLMFAAGQGAEFGQKVGVVMLGGVLTSAILTFFVVPAAFYRFERKHTSAKDLQAVTVSTE